MRGFDIFLLLLLLWLCLASVGDEKEERWEPGRRWLVCRTLLAEAVMRQPCAGTSHMLCLGGMITEARDAESVSSVTNAVVPRQIIVGINPTGEKP